MTPQNNVGPRTQKGRIRFVLIIVTFFGILVLGRLFQLQFLKHDYYLRIAASQHWQKDEVPASRGKIYVRDSTAPDGLYSLVTNQRTYLLYAESENVEDKEQAAAKISTVVGIEADKIKNLLINNHTYVVIKHYLTFDQAEKIRGLAIKGIGLSEEQQRYYPEGKMASQLLGYVDTEGEGRYGLEEYYNDILSGVPGLSRSEVGAVGQKIAFGDNVSVEPKDGSDLVLTINRDIQNQAEQMIAQTVKKFSAEKGSMIVMDPSNGEILAMANAPSYDPSKYKEVKDYSLFQNSAVSDEFEPGSIFKVITVAAGLDTGKIKPDTKFEDKGQLVLNGHKIMNSDKKAHGEVDMTYVLSMSLNTGTTYIMQQIGKSTFYQYLKKFGFGKLTGIEHPSEGLGYFPTPDKAKDHTYATMTFGQSISTTPIQMISAFAAVANGGKLVKPHLVAEKRLANGKKEVTDNSLGARVMSEKAAADERTMMVAVVEKGHGKQARVAGYEVAGKTGTAQVPLKNGVGYDPNRNIGSFIGMAPAGIPKFVIMAKIDSPKGIPWAESSAAPVVGQMTSWLLNYYQIPPTGKIK